MERALEYHRRFVEYNGRRVEFHNRIIVEIIWSGDMQPYIYTVTCGVAVPGKGVGVPENGLYMEMGLDTRLCRNIKKKWCSCYEYR